MTPDAEVSTAPPRTEETAELAELRDEVWAGLQDRVLSSRWFYDHRGSELFEEITRLPEYYPTRTERRLLVEHATAWMESLRPGILVELGAGSARKTRILLDALQEERPGAVYVPLDVSADFLATTARELRAEYPHLRIEPEVADLLHPLDIADHGPGPTLFAFLGSTLGNFTPDAAAGLLGRIREAMKPEDTFLLGVDLRPGPGKSLEELEAAYNDAQGVTAKFNRNMLFVLNSRAGTDFAPEYFGSPGLLRRGHGPHRDAPRRLDGDAGARARSRGGALRARRVDSHRNLVEVRPPRDRRALPPSQSGADGLAARRPRALRHGPGAPSGVTVPGPVHGSR